MPSSSTPSGSASPRPTTWIRVSGRVEAAAVATTLGLKWQLANDIAWTRLSVRLPTDGGEIQHLLAPVDVPLPQDIIEVPSLNVVDVVDFSADSVSVRPHQESSTAPESLMLEGDSPAAPLLMTLPVFQTSTEQSLATGGLFVVDASSGGSVQLLLTRLLRLGADSAQVSAVTVDGHTSLLVFVDVPPYFLALSALENPAEGTQFFVSRGADLWVEWGHEHPLETAAKATAQRLDATVLVSRTGQWQLLDKERPTQSIFDIVMPTLKATEQTLGPMRATPNEVTDRFEVRLRLEATEATTPDLWLVTPSVFERVGGFLYSASPEEVERLTVARLGTPEGRALYLVRERTGPGDSPTGLSLSELFQTPGFVRLESTDNFYLPAGRRLRPRLRREDLRELLELDASELVLLEEDGDGIRLTTVSSIDEKPISKWVELVATDRRRELDRMLEDSVLSFPAFSIDQPEGAAPKQKPAPPRKRRPKVERQRLEPVPAPTVVHDDTGDAQDAAAKDAEALLAQARPLELDVAKGGHRDPQTWSTLGHLREALEDEGQASTCFEAALFYRGEPHLRELLGTTPSSSTDAARLLHCRHQPFPQVEASDEVFLDLLMRPRMLSHEAAWLGSIAVSRLLARDQVAMEALPTLIQVFKDRNLPVSRRLAWSVLLTCHLVTDDSLGLTRAKEAVLGGLNDKGLNDAYDLPRFIRLELALEESDDESEVHRTKLDQLTALEAMWDAAAGDAIDGFDVDGAFLRAQFGVAFARLGALGNARAMVRPLEEELPAHDEPNRLLLSLYLARLAHASTQGDQAAWKAEVASTLGSVDNIRVRRTVEWLRKRSSWLNPERDVPPAPWIRPEFEKKLARAEDEGHGFAETISTAFRTSELYDYELSASVERMLAGALATGDEGVLAQTLDVAQTRLDRVQILGHRAAATGACIRAAATLGDLSRVDAFLQTVIEIARAPNVPSMRALLGAVDPALIALRRLGGSESGIRFLGAIEKVDVRSVSEQLRLTAAIADGLMNLDPGVRPMQLIDGALEQTLHVEMDHVGRFEAATAIVTSLHHWPLSARTERCQALLENLGTFRDTFTTSAYFGTHRILLCEAIIDALCDEETVQSDRVHAFLDAEEQAIRQVIAADWSALCGR